MLEPGSSSIAGPQRRVIHACATALMVVALGALSGCVDSPSEPLEAVDQTPLATSFDALAQEMASADVERSEEFRWAAMAVRSGVGPSALEVTNNGVPEVYEAFVHHVSWVSATDAIRPPMHRNLIAWRRGGGSMQVIIVGLASDSAPVLHPWSMRPASPGAPASPILGAKAAYFERTDDGGTSWVGIGGNAKVAAKSNASVCVPPLVDNNAYGGGPLPGVACQLTEYVVQLNILFARTPSRDSRDVTASAMTRRILAAEQTVPGVKLVFSCAQPTPMGCQ